MKKLIAYYEANPGTEYLKILIPQMLTSTFVFFTILLCISAYFNGPPMVNILLMIVYLFLSGIFFMINRTIQSLGDGKPYMVLDQKGLTMKWYGFIPWDNIKSAHIDPPRHGHQFLIIRIKSSKKLLPQVSLCIKIGILLQILFRSHNKIYIGQTTVPIEKICDFIEKHI